MHTALTIVCPLTLCAWRLGDLPVDDLWLRYLALGGGTDPGALADYLNGSTRWPVREHTVLAVALNERLWDLGIASLAPLRL